MVTRRRHCVDRSCAVVAQRDAVPGELGVPGRQRVAPDVAGAHAGEQRVALGQRLRVAAARRASAPATAPPRPGRGARGAATAAPLISSRRSGRKTLTSGRDGCSPSPSTGDAVDADPLRLARLEADAQLVRAVATLDLDLNPSRRLAEAHDLALVARAARAAGAAEVQRLEEVRLAGAVAAVDDGQPGAEGDVRARVGAEVPHPEARDTSHGPGSQASDVEPDRHDQVEEPAVVAGLDQARAAAG